MLSHEANMAQIRVLMSLARAHHAHRAPEKTSMMDLVLISELAHLALWCHLRNCDGSVASPMISLHATTPTDFEQTTEQKTFAKNHTI